MNKKNKLKKFLKTSSIYIIFSTIKYVYQSYIKIGRRKKYAYRSVNSIVNCPCFFNPSLVELHEQTRISTRLRLMSYTGKLIVKKYSSIAADCTVITQNHKSTVSIPQSWLDVNHINDVEKDMIIEEDVWVGHGTTLLYGARLGRGCIVGANSLVNKEIPPYAVVAGCPAKIIAVKFSKEQILNHEKYLYSKDERLSEEYLDNLFNTLFYDKKIYGTSILTQDDRNIIDKFKEKTGYDYVK